MNERGAADRPSTRVAIALVWKEGALLLTRRRPGAHLEGLWEFPGGKIEEGETAEHCAEREVREETGVFCRARARRGEIHHDYSERRVTLLPVDCQWVDGEPTEREVTDARWVRPERLDDYEMPAANRSLVEEVATTGALF